ncbi:MAG: HD domain-containing protein [Actinobacteria bacterium]|nr:MAG: HD domain-containing protein [Actinomycetota bacterium]
MVNPSTRLFLAVVYTLAVAACVAALRQTAEVPLLGLLLFVTLSFLSDSLAVDVPLAAMTSVTFSVLLAAMVLFGPTVAIAAAVVTGANWQDLKARVPIHKIAYNSAQASLAVYVAAFAYSIFGGQYGSGWSFPHSLLPTLAASVAFLATNMLLLSGVIALSEKISPFSVLKADFLPYFGNNLALVVLAVLMIKVFLTVGPAGLILLVAPLLVARQTLQVYVKLKEAYQGTVRSLVAAIEAKDAYTKGHSERVADYSERIARQIGLAEEEIEKLKIAALLHDLGKIGIQRRILSKSDKLSADEYRLMREHPELAAGILRNVDFLEEVIPTIYHHHEHVDGTGYVKRLRGDEIPLTARILAVADAYDAMTSARPYRPPLSEQAAAGELLSCCGSQFDRKIVQALLDAICVYPERGVDPGVAEGQLTILEETT